MNLGAENALNALPIVQIRVRLLYTHTLTRFYPYFYTILVLYPTRKWQFVETRGTRSCIVSMVAAPLFIHGNENVL